MAHLLNTASLPASLRYPETGGLLGMIGALILLPISDTRAKLLSQDIHAAVVVAWRPLIQGLVLGLIALVLRTRLKSRVDFTTSLTTRSAPSARCLNPGAKGGDRLTPKSFPRHNETRTLKRKSP